jgi:hypothetical protein
VLPCDAEEPNLLLRREREEREREEGERERKEK